MPASAVRTLRTLPALTFSDLGLCPDLVQTVAGLGYESPSPIQREMIPVLLAGGDAIGQARTGTGKTAAFALPMLQRLAESDARGVVRGLVLVPTRELAVQVSSAVFTYGQALGFRTLPVYGGQAYQKQTKRLQQGVDVVVATPGRLVDLLNQGAIRLDTVETVVLDEADEMLSMGFADDLELILGTTPASRQTALLSATMPAQIRRIADTYLRDPQTVAVASGDKTAQDVEQRGYVVHGRDKFAALVRLLETEDVTSALCFVRTRATTAALAADLQAAGYAAEAISGELSQAQRTDVLHRFKTQQVRILVATDVAARGLDIDHVSHVFNVDLPIDIESYVHRVGRTGRAGRSGVALSLVSPGESGLIRRIQGYVKREIPATPLPTIDEVQALRDQRFAAEFAAAFDGEIRDADRGLVLDLVADGRDPMEVAAAALALARSSRPQAPLLPIAEPRSRAQRQHGADRHGEPHRTGRSNGGVRDAAESGMVRLSLDAGHTSGVRPNMVVSAIARTADVPGRSLGKIVIQERHTFVDVPETMVERVLAHSGSFRFGPRTVEIERA